LWLGVAEAEQEIMVVLLLAVRVGVLEVFYQEVLI
jgi:hypothetical protein